MYRTCSVVRYIISLKKITERFLSFKSGNGIQRSESGRLVGGDEQTVQGGWEYIDPDGQVST